MTEDHDLTRSRIHDLADSLQAVMVKTAVIEERQKSAMDALGRIEHTMTEGTQLLGGLLPRVAVLEDRANEARDTAAKYGAGLGAFVAALIAGTAAFFGKHS